MAKTITVKGIGKASTAPDYVVITMELEARNMDYEKAMNKAAKNIELLNAVLESAGFDKKAVKTTSFNVHTDYEYRRKNDGSNERYFAGYIVNHQLKLAFDFDSERLAKAVSAVGSCPAQPRINIGFTVKDASAISEEMLRSATANARRKAEILCDASGSQLGELLSIDYNWGELNVFSDTRYNVAEECMAERAICSEIEFEPDDIETTDTATFVWELR